MAAETHGRSWSSRGPCFLRVWQAPCQGGASRFPRILGHSTFGMIRHALGTWMGGGKHVAGCLVKFSMGEPQENFQNLDVSGFRFVYFKKFDWSPESAPRAVEERVFECDIVDPARQVPSAKIFFGRMRRYAHTGIFSPWSWSWLGPCLGSVGGHEPEFSVSLALCRRSGYGCAHASIHEVWSVYRRSKCKRL